MSWKDIMKQVGKDKIEHIRELLFDYDNEEVGKKIVEAMEDMPRRRGYGRLAHRPPRSHKDSKTRDQYWKAVHYYLDLLEAEIEGKDIPKF